ncbi:MAG: hypothetical protein QXY50_02865 [Candidatus Caldarchaeum sp.]
MSEQLPEDLEQEVKRLVQLYRQREQQLKNQVLELQRLVSMERQAKLAIEAQLMQVKDEVEGLLKGGIAVTKQAVMLLLYLEERYNGIVNAARQLRRSRIPYGLLALAAFASVSAGGAAYVLSQPGNLQLLVQWLSLWTNQLFIAVTAVSALGVLAFLLRRRRRTEAL